MEKSMSGKGFVRLDAALKGADNSDADIIRAARVSTGRHLEDVTDEKLAGMINFLYRDHHLTPFQKIVFRFHIKCSIRAARQFFCVLFSSHNEFSGRYATFPENDFYVPSSFSPETRELAGASQRRSYADYQKLLSLGVAKEQARLALPYSFFTQFYWTVDLRTLFEFFDETKENPRCGREDFQTLLEELKKIVSREATVAYQTYARWSAERARNHDAWIKALAQKVQNWSMLRVPFVDTAMCERQCTHEEILGGKVHLTGIHGDPLTILGAAKDIFSAMRSLDQMTTHWEMELPIFVWRQLVRHRKGYPVELADDTYAALYRKRLYIPPRFRRQAGKVGHYTFEDFGEADNLAARRTLEQSYEQSVRAADFLLKNGVSHEEAAILIPYSFYTCVRWVLPLGSLINIFLLRLDSHAQWETRQYVSAMYRLFKAKQPDIADVFEQFFWPRFWNGQPFPGAEKGDGGE